MKIIKKNTKTKIVLYSILALHIVIFSSTQSLFALNGEYDANFFAENAIFFYNPDDTGCITNTGDGSNSCKINEEKLASTTKTKLGPNVANANAVLNILLSSPIKANDDKPMGKKQAIAMLGNMAQESGLDPKASNGTHNGIVQWSGSDRWTGIASEADPYSIDVQAKYIIKELNGEGSTGGNYGKTLADAGFFSGDDLDTLVKLDDDHYEVSGGSAMENRKTYAKEMFEALDCESSSSGLSSSTGGSGGITDTINTTFKYKSHLNEPYILEHFAIHLLRAIGQMTNTPDKTMITQEKVLTIVTYAIKEGGDIQNTSKFNPFNLGGGEGYIGTPNGIGTFPDFDTMITAYARQLTGGTQNRLGKTLIKENFTYHDYNYAMSHFEEFPGNELWAEAGGLRGDTAAHDAYTKTLDGMVASTQADYKNRSSIVIGTDAFEQRDGIRREDLLAFDGSGVVIGDFSGGGSSDNCGTSSGVLSGTLAQTASKLAWNNSKQENFGKIKPEYEQSLKDNGWSTSLSYAQDCGHFVTAIMHSSGVDKEFPAGGTSNMESYMSSSKKYEKVTATSTSDLKPGDILVVNMGGGAGASGHIYMYIGDTTGDDGKTYDSASASLSQYTGIYTNAFLSDSRGAYSIFRHNGDK